MTRGEIWWADLGIPFGNEPGLKRPVLVVQNDDLNKSRIHTVAVILFSTNLLLVDAPGNVLLEREETGLPKDSVLVSSQITTIDRTRLVEKIAKVENRLFGVIEDGILIVLGMRKIG